MIPVAEIREYLGLTNDATVTDATLELLRDASLNEIEAKLSRRLTSQEYTKSFTGCELLLNYPVTAFAISPEVEYTLDEATGILKVPYGEYEITYTAGYTNATLPSDLRLAINEVSYSKWTNLPTKQSRLGVSSKTVNSQGVATTVNYKEYDYSKLIANYKNWKI